MCWPTASMHNVEQAEQILTEEDAGLREEEGEGRRLSEVGDCPGSGSVAGPARRDSQPLIFPASIREHEPALAIKRKLLALLPEASWLQRESGRCARPPAPPAPPRPPGRPTSSCSTCSLGTFLGAGWLNSERHPASICQSADWLLCVSRRGKEEAPPQQRIPAPPPLAA